MHMGIHSIRFKVAVFMVVALSLLTLDGNQALAWGANAAGSSRRASAQPADIVRDPAEVPPPVGNRAATIVKVELVAKEVVGELDPATGTTYRYWTFNGKVPGPMIRVRQGDMVEVTLRNDASSHMAHSIDFHAAIGPGGGAALSQVLPGQGKTFTFQATTPGLFVYHCGTPMIADHIANGMYGLMLVEPPGGLPHADREYYVMQGEVYTTAPKGKPGLQGFSEAKLMQETPEYFVFNGAVDALTKEHPLHANVGETVRIFFGDAGPNATSSPHMVGEIFSREYHLGSLASPPVNGVQTASVPPGAAAILELKATMPGKFTFMDHAMARMAKGLVASLDVTGAQNAALMHAGPAIASTADSNWVSGTIQAEKAAISGKGDIDPVSVPRMHNSAATPVEEANADEMSDMPQQQVGRAPVKRGRTHGAGVSSPSRLASNTAPTALNGCLTLLSDGRVMLKLLHSEKTYRLEARPLLFDENDNHLVHVTGYVGSVVPVEDPHIPSFVVDTLEELAPNCSAKISPVALQKRLAKITGGQPGTAVTVGMGEMEFKPRTIVVNVGQHVVWKNTSLVVHNVVNNGSALNKADVERPAEAKQFGSGYLQPGQSFAHTFTVRGVYRYVCTLHEANGMKGVVIVKAPGATNIARATAPTQ